MSDVTKKAAMIQKFLLILCAAVGLTACNNKGGTSDEDTGYGRSSSSSSNTNSTGLTNSGAAPGSSSIDTNSNSALR